MSRSFGLAMRRAGWTFALLLCNAAAAQGEEETVASLTKQLSNSDEAGADCGCRRPGQLRSRCQAGSAGPGGRLWKIRQPMSAGGPHAHWDTSARITSPSVLC